MIIRELNIKRTPFASTLEFNMQENCLFYAGIGSRGTPLKIGEIMIKLAYYYSLSGYGLRSGGAEGADTFFEIGADLAKIVDPTKGVKQIFLPRKDFFFHPSEFHFDNENFWKDGYSKEIMLKELGMLAGQFHNGLASMDEEARGLMIRNGQQVMGPYLNEPSLAIICWTPDGAINHEERNTVTGGTGQAISIASCEYIVTGSGKNRYVKDESQQVINLARPDHLEKTLSAISDLRSKFGEMPDWRKELKWKSTKEYKPSVNMR